MLEMKWNNNIMDCISEGLIIIDLHGDVSYINAAGSVILGLDPDNITGKKFADCFLNDPENDSLEDFEYV